MNADERRSGLDEVTNRIIGCVYRVSNVLGCGFLEKVYENALMIELCGAGLRVKQQHPLRVFYRELVVGEFTADLLVEETVVVELKAVRVLDEVHTAQCMNYLRASGLGVCLLINFAKPRVEIKRIVSGF